MTIKKNKSFGHEKKTRVKFPSRSPPASTRRKELDKLIGRHVQESIQINSSKTELLERSLLWLSCCSDIGLNVRLKFISIAKTKKENKSIREKLDDSSKPLFGSRDNDRSLLGVPARFDHFPGKISSRGGD
jgi:hypothetical protein